MTKSDNDQAAVEALSKIKYEIRGKHAQGSWAQEYTIRPEAARAILDAIRAGEVPGVCMVPEDDIPLQHERDVLNKILDDTAAVLSHTTVAFEGGMVECAKAVLAEVEREKARADKAEKRLADYDARLTAVMAPDFKCWHQNSRDEWPEVAAWVINNLRQQIEVEKFHADKAEAEAAKCNDLCAEIGGDDPAECLDIVRGDNMAHEGVVKELDNATAERDQLRAEVERARKDKP